MLHVCKAPCFDPCAQFPNGAYVNRRPPVHGAGAVPCPHLSLGVLDHSHKILLPGLHKERRHLDMLQSHQALTSVAHLLVVGVF